jgi:hypothetical protein
MMGFLNNTVKIKGVYSSKQKTLLYRLSSHSGFNPNDLEKLKDCLFNDVLKAIQCRHSQQVGQGTDGDIRRLMNGLFGESRIDQTVAVDQLLKLDFSQVFNILNSQQDELLPYMTVNEVMNCYRCRRDESGLLNQSMFQNQGSNQSTQQASAIFRE